MNKLTIIMILILIILNILLLLMCGCRTTIPTHDMINSTPDIKILTDIIYKTNWLVVFGILGTGLSVFAGILGWRHFIAGVGGGACLAGMTLLAERIRLVPQWWWNVGVVAGLLFCGAYLVYQIFIRNRGLKEVVQTFEEYKTTLTDTDKEYIRTKIQSPSTTKLVSEIKGNPCNISNPGTN